MKKNKDKILCAFCGEPAKSKDHVPPKGVFPDPKPTDLITVPACKKCNSETKLDDEYFRWLVATGSAKSETAVKLIKQRVLPRFKRRSALLRNIMKGSVEVAVYSEGGIYLGRKPAFRFDRSRIQVVIDKTVRGLYYHELGVVLSTEVVIKDFLLNPIIDDKYKQTVLSFPLRNIGGGIFSYRFHANKDVPSESFWFLMFFDKTLFLTKTQSNTYKVPGVK